MEYLKLGETINLLDLKSIAINNQSTEFTANSSQVNLDDDDVRATVKQWDEIEFPPLNPTEELIQALYIAALVSPKEQWNAIVLMTYYDLLLK